MWQDENYDRIIRDEDEFIKTIKYIRQNPVKRGLSKDPDKYSFLYVK